MIKLKNIKKNYKENEVLKNINITFGNKGLVTILGKSGSGKSTLLNIIGKIDNPSSGEIYWNNYNLNKINKKEIDSYHKNIVGFIFQQYNLLNYLSVKENILLTSKDKNIKELLEKLDISKHDNTKVNKLSGGEQERVAIARAIINNPKILLCDEPTGALDSNTSTKIMNIIKEYSKDHLVIMVTHDLEIANKYSDRIIELKDGLIVNDTNPLQEEEIENIKLSKYNFSLKKIYQIAKNNLKNKKKRYAFTILASMIGLISLSLVLGISKGFQNTLDNYEKETLGDYPIIISKVTNDIEDSINKIFDTSTKDTNKVYVESDYYVNDLNKEFKKNLNKLNKFKKYSLSTFSIENTTITTINNYNNYNYENEFSIIKGKFIKNKNEVNIVLGKNNNISSSLMQSINLNAEEYNYEDLIDYTYKLNNEEYKIVGIIKAKEDSPFYDNSFILYNVDTDEIPNSIYIYPINYESKLSLKKELKKYKKIKYIDYASTIKNISNSIIKAMSIILIIFSVISLIVSVLMTSLTTYISIYERIHEIGLLSSLGVNRKNIKTIFYIENIILAIISGEITIELLIILKYPINKILFTIIGFQNILQIDYKINLFILAINIMLSIIGSLIPIRNVTKLKITDALKYE